MHRPAALAGTALALAALAACDGSTISDPGNAVEALDATALAAVGRSILMLDQCDPESFNAALGADSCVNRNGGVTFDTFIQQLERQQTVPSWIFTPQVIHVAHEMTLPVVNRGGEVHTFTEVEEFGGGIVPILNMLSGNPTAAPECMSLGPTDFIPAGGQTMHHFEPGESEKYQCCIHPWMRSMSR
jgi:hypothetical protein